MRRRIVWINLGLVVLLVAAGVGAYLWLFAPQEAEPTGRTVAVQSGTVSETVTATGTVETTGAIDVAFDTSGIVDTVRVEEGDTVFADKKLATLDDTSERQAVSSAKNSYVQAVSSSGQTGLSLASAQQAVSDAQRNATLNEKSYQQSVDVARRNLADAKSSWTHSCLDPTGSCPDQNAWAQLRAAEGDIASATTAYEQAVQTATLQEETNQVKLSQAQVSAEAAQAKQDSACNTYGSDSTQCTSAVDARRSAEQQYELLVTTNQAAAITAQQTLVNAADRITQTNVALRKLQATLRTQSADSVDAARDALDTALLTQKKGTAADKQAVQRAQESLAAQSAASRPVTVGSSTVTPDQASIDLAERGLVAARASLAQTVLRAPVAGVIGSVDMSAGDPATPGTPVVTILPDAPFQIVADFSEADAMKVAVGQPASVTFDALPDASATGTVTSVAVLPTDASSGANATSSVTTYAATITLDSTPDGIREGMSASVIVTTQEVSGALWAPTAAITTAGGQSTVTVRVGGTDEVVSVQTGLAGDSGVEITSGVSEGDQLVVSSGDASGGFSGFPIGGIPGGGLGGGRGGGPQP